MAILRRIFRRPNLNSNMDVSSSKAGRGLFVVLGLAVVLVLATGAYMYGQQRRDESSQKPGNEQQQQTSGAENPTPAEQNDTTEPEQTAQNNSDAQPQDANEDESTNTANNNPAANPVTGPESVVNTGPEDYYPLAVALIVMFGWYYLRARRANQKAQFYN
jgi:uncharacterized protein HemX